MVESFGFIGMYLVVPELIVWWVVKLVAIPQKAKWQYWWEDACEN
ncbi:MAG: hypothetical protein P7H58_29350 (plasmid) [Microcoleus anatoxicus]